MGKAEHEAKSGPVPLMTLCRKRGLLDIEKVRDLGGAEKLAGVPVVARAARPP